MENIINKTPQLVQNLLHVVDDDSVHTALAYIDGHEKFQDIPKLSVAITHRLKYLQDFGADENIHILHFKSRWLWVEIRNNKFQRVRLVIL